VATDLFYRQGFRATGINEVILKSGVAKATFYSHFPSKDDLGLAYLERIMEGEVKHLDSFIQAANDRLGRFYAVIRSLEPWLLSTNFRGCPFLNMASETPDPKHPLRKAGRKVYDVARERVESLTRGLISSDSRRYGHLDAEEIVAEYMVAFAGAIALAEIYHAIWPVEDALKTVRRLIGDSPD